MIRKRGFEIVREDMRKTTGEVTLPKRSSSKAMAYDFYANDTYVVEPGKIAKIWTDVKAYMGECECLILTNISENSPTSTSGEMNRFFFFI